MARDEQASVSDRFGMRQVLNAALADLERFEGRKTERTAAAYSAWRQQTIADYEAWRQRLRSSLPQSVPQGR